MRKPTTNEVRLMLLFGVMIFMLVNISVMGWFSFTREKLTAELAQLEQSAIEYRALIAERPQWEMRRKWYEGHQPEIHQGQASDSHFAEEIQRTLTQNGLNIEAQQMKESAQDGALIEAQLDLTVKGNLEKMVRWLNEIQQPGNHVVLQAIELRRLDESSAMVAKIRIGKIFRLEGFASTP